MKDHAIEDEDVRAALRTWTKRRIELITGFRTFILYEYSEPIGCVSCFRAQNITRIRDLFIQKDFRSRGYSKFLFSGIKKMPGPFAIVTDTHNSAIYPYRKLGFEPIFVAEAYLILNYDKNKQ